jgi:hypothetical protein
MKNISASLLTALEFLSGIRHLLHISALLIARIVRYIHIPALLDIHGVKTKTNKKLTLKWKKHDNCMYMYCVILWYYFLILTIFSIYRGWGFGFCFIRKSYPASVTSVILRRCPFVLERLRQWSWKVAIWVTLCWCYVYPNRNNKMYFTCWQRQSLLQCQLCMQKYIH